MELEDKVKEIVQKFPGLRGLIKSYQKGSTIPVCTGPVWTGGIKDIAYEDAGKYQIAAAKWEEHHWAGVSGIEWTVWLELYFKKKGKGKVKRIETGRIKIRDMYNPCYDRKEYWGVNYVTIQKVENDKVEVLWHDKKKENGKLYKFDLKEKEAQVIGTR